MGNFVILTGIILVIFGLVINFIAKLHLPLLPGDILVQKDNFTFYLPFATSIIFGIILTIIINLFK